MDDKMPDEAYAAIFAIAEMMSWENVVFPEDFRSIAVAMADKYEPVMGEDEVSVEAVARLARRLLETNHG